MCNGFAPFVATSANLLTVDVERWRLPRPQPQRAVHGPVSRNGAPRVSTPGYVCGWSKWRVPSVCALHDKKSVQRIASIEFDLFTSGLANTGNTPKNTMGRLKLVSHYKALNSFYSLLTAH